MSTTTRIPRDFSFLFCVLNTLTTKHIQTKIKTKKNRGDTNRASWDFLCFKSQDKHVQNGSIKRHNISEWVISKNTASYALGPSKSRCTKRFCSLEFHEFPRFHACTSSLLLCFASPVFLPLPQPLPPHSLPSHFLQIELSSSSSSSFPPSSFPLELKTTPHGKN